MDKNAVKKYAVWARRELIQRVSQRAMLYGVTERDAGDPDAESVNGRPLSADEKRQRRALIRKVEDKGYEQTMEQAAYTWFNRFAALRFMEVNGYLPSHVRVFTNDKGEFKPQILDEAIHLELDGLDRNKVYELEGANRREELYKYLLITQCNALYGILPGLFGRIDDYAALLLPDNLLREGSVIERMVSAIPEEDWKDQVQIIGWLYEAYNTEMNLIVYDGSFSKDKIPKELLPAATTIDLFGNPLRGVLKVVNSANQGGAKGESFPFVSVAIREDVKTLDIAVDMFNFNPAFGNLTVEFLLFFGQLMVFGRLDGNRTVRVKFLQALKSFILHGFNLVRHMGSAVFIQLKIMRSPRSEENA